VGRVVRWEVVHLESAGKCRLLDYSDSDTINIINYWSDVTNLKLLNLPY